MLSPWRGSCAMRGFRSRSSERSCRVPAHLTVRESGASPPRDRRLRLLHTRLRVTRRPIAGVLALQRGAVDPEAEYALIADAAGAQADRASTAGRTRRVVDGSAAHQFTLEGGHSVARPIGSATNVEAPDAATATFPARCADTVELTGAAALERGDHATVSLAAARADERRPALSRSWNRVQEPPGVRCRIGPHRTLGRPLSTSLAEAEPGR